MTDKQRKRFDELKPAQQAGIMCSDTRFQQFIGTRTIKSGAHVNASGCAEYIRQFCQVTSRRHINTSRAALRKFQVLRTEFDAWTGKIPTPR